MIAVLWHHATWSLFTFIHTLSIFNNQAWHSASLSCGYHALVALDGSNVCFKLNKTEQPFLTNWANLITLEVLMRLKTDVPTFSLLLSKAQFPSPSEMRIIQIAQQQKWMETQICRKKRCYAVMWLFLRRVNIYILYISIMYQKSAAETPFSRSRVMWTSPGTTAMSAGSMEDQQGTLPLTPDEQRIIHCVLNETTSSCPTKGWC